MLVENYSNSRQVRPVDVLAIFDRASAQPNTCWTTHPCIRTPPILETSPPQNGSYSWDIAVVSTCHTFSAFWLRSSVVSVLISMTTDMLPIW